MRAAFIFFFLFILFFIVKQNVFAQTIYQTSQSLDVTVGNPSSSRLVDTAQYITQRLKKTFGRSVDMYDQLIGGSFTIPNSPYPNYVVQMRGGKACLRGNVCVYTRYWCTDLLIDTYNISLGKRVLGENLGTVQNMVSFWQGAGGSFVFAHYSAGHIGALQKLFTTAPSFGAAIFFESSEGYHNGFEHVALIRGGSLDSHGNGEIDTYEANSWTTTGKYPVYNWQVKNTPYPVVGFGLYTGVLK